MKPHQIVALCLLASGLFAADKPGVRTIPLSELRDRIAGGWAGQMIGVSYGAPTEFHYRGVILPEDKLPRWSPEKVDNSLDQDDLYVDMTFAKVLDDKGLDATTEDFGDMFRDSKYRLWHANLAARRALKRGVPATLSGTPKYNAHANDIDFQIESDFIGLMAPGMPRSASDIALRAGRVMNYGDGIYGGIFVSCMYSAAFVEKDPHRVVEAGLACLSADSPYARLISDLLNWHRQYPNDWQKVWQLLEDKWDKRDPCPDGALMPFNIDAKLNGGYIALGLLFGDGDMRKTIEIATRSGQDSDCNPSSAAGILGVLLGWKGIPEIWKSGIPAIEDRKFSYTNFTYKTIVESTYNRALALAKKKGGRVEGDALVIELETPNPRKLEVWDDYGSPVERILNDDPRWKFAGNWTVNPDGQLRSSAEKGAEATVDFEGSGAILTGDYCPGCGQAEVYLDGKRDARVDVYQEDGTRSGEAVWHRFDLSPGRHTLRLVVLGQPFRDSKGSLVAVKDLVVFRR